MAWDNRNHTPVNEGTFFTQGSWEYTPGRPKPWWMSADRYAREQAKYKIGQAPSANQWTSDWQDKYASQMQWMKDYLYSTGASGTTTLNTPQYTPVNWSDYEGQYQGQTDAMQSLLDRIQAGYSSTDMADARNNVASMFGMTPEQYQAQQDYFNVAPGSAEQLAQQQRNQEMAGSLATQNDEVYQKFQEQIRSQQRIATADAAKQLETIFAGRGGLGGFAQAYEYTTQIADQALQQSTQFTLDRYNQALTNINADNDRKRAMIEQGQLSTQQFLSDRWNQLQTAYQNTVVAANMTMQEFNMRSDANRADFETQLNAFLQPLESMKDILMDELAIDQASYEAYNNWYDTNIRPYLDQLALGV